MGRLSVNAARCEALFVFTLVHGNATDSGAVQTAISRAIGEFGVRGCAEWVAQEFGDHPETAASRMRWACGVVEKTFPARSRTGTVLPERTMAVKPVLRAA